MIINFVKLIKTNKRNELEFSEKFGEFFLKNKEILTSVSLIYLKYLSPKLVFGTKESYDEELESLSQTILFFLTNHKHDLFSKSLALISEDHFELYFNQTSSTSFIEINALESRVRNLVQLVKQNQIEVTESVILEKLTKITKAISQDISASKNKFSYFLQITKSNLPFFILLTLNICDTGDEENPDFIECLKILTNSLENNLSGQTVLFMDFSFFLYERMFQKHNVLMMLMVRKIFQTNATMFKSSNRVFLLQMKIYKHLIIEFIAIGRSDSETYATIHVLGLFNCFFEELLVFMNKSTKNKSRYDLIVSEEICDLITEEVLPALFNREFLSDYSDVNFEHFFETKYDFKGYSEFKKSATKIQPQVLKFALYVSFLRLFNRSTNCVFSGNVYMKIKKKPILLKLKT